MEAAKRERESRKQKAVRSKKKKTMMKTTTRNHANSSNHFCAVLLPLFLATSIMVVIIISMMMPFNMPSAAKKVVLVVVAFELPVETPKLSSWPRRLRRSTTTTVPHPTTGRCGGGGGGEGGSSSSTNIITATNSPTATTTTTTKLCMSKKMTTHMANEWDQMVSSSDETSIVDVWDPKNTVNHHHHHYDDDDGREQQQPLYMSPSKLPSKSNLIKNSTHRLTRKQIQCAITDIKRYVEDRFEQDLNLIKHTTPLAFLVGTGINDDLDGSQSKSSVKFVVSNEDIPRGVLVTTTTETTTSSTNPDDDPDVSSSSKTKSYPMECEIVQSLAKWKRLMLQRLDCDVGEGLYCDSTSVRKGYKGDVTHSVIADQWDFEIRLSKEQRTQAKLKDYVTKIWKIIVDTETMIVEKYPEILSPNEDDECYDDDEYDPWHLDEPKLVKSSSAWRLPKQIHFITSEELHAEFPHLMDVHERETAAVRKYGAIFICGMGWPLRDGSPPEEVRSPSYDDWNLNGDIMVYHPLTEYRHELSSMGIRVDADSLRAQLEHRGLYEKESTLDFQKAVLKNELPFSYGGGIGISRLCMLLLRTCHIGEVQVGVWHDEHYKQVLEAGIDLIPDRILSPDVLAAAASGKQDSGNTIVSDVSQQQEEDKEENKLLLP